ncbi:DUF4270 domain-containing protein [Fulvivirga sp. 1062]|uniref:DUF4270 domain-containing protein n=2 Tax=Fulvivirga sedimenti TaxID=2879465 RepID=A0A9X1HQC6_9BACT|nr:DUF4270 domain-containing protein [Fulvivirga sedimenti]
MLLSVPLFFSCREEENTIGLPPENNLGIFFVEIPLRDYVSQVWVDDISSRARDAMLVGSYTDENFGFIKAEHFSEVLLPEVNPGKRFQADASFDSLVLEMRINGVTGNQMLFTEQGIEVYQLADTIQAFEKNYFNYSTQEVGLKLGEKTFFVYPDSVNLNFSDTNLPDSSDERSLYDTNGDYIYMTRVTLDPAFGEQFFQEMKTDTTSSSKFSSSTDFAAYFKGLNLRSPQTNSAILRYSPFDGRTRMVVYYSQVEDDTLRQKSVKFAFSRTINYNNIAPNRDQGWMGSDFDEINSFYEQIQLDTGYAYVQAGTNLFLSMDMTPFKLFADTVANPIIQSAVLLFEDIAGEQDDEGTALELPNFLSFRITTKDSLEAGYYDVIPEVFSEFPRSNVEYNEDINGYRVEIPLYLQSVLTGRNKFDQVIITVSDIDPASGQIRAENRSFKRFIADKDNMKIRLYYTIPDANTE